ncbi:thioesterase family protein [Desulforhabdus amnigena]|uniref:Thioesterase n=1 Tax=Desulforhabdus amnigena TaxID=40218 RepID=A0A9W6FTR4_9BACT|nr:thioesterase family protein [Desulforhabdus amnigena]GLI34595.1 thioesterase [Desulforhabdus amnigena]
MTSQANLEPGMKGTSSGMVDAHNTAIAMGSGEVEVFATPAVVALMEAAAVQCLKGRLAAGETSVGVRMELSHIAATPVGMQVRAEASLEKIDGRRLFFRVTAYDEVEKIGEGEHERFIVQKDRFFSRVLGKKETSK